MSEKEYKVRIYKVNGELGWTVQADTVQEANLLKTELLQLEKETTPPADPFISSLPTEEKKKVAAAVSGDTTCPKCNGPMWDNRKDKRNPKAPDYKCKDNDCKDDKGYVTGLWR